jgi:hypothetical protein
LKYSSFKPDFVLTKVSVQIDPWTYEIVPLLLRSRAVCAGADSDTLGFDDAAGSVCTIAPAGLEAGAGVETEAAGVGEDRGSVKSNPCPSCQPF